MHDQSRETSLESLVRHCSVRHLSTHIQRSLSVDSQSLQSYNKTSPTPENTTLLLRPLTPIIHHLIPPPPLTIIKLRTPSTKQLYTPQLAHYTYDTSSFYNAYIHHQFPLPRALFPTLITFISIIYYRLPSLVPFSKPYRKAMLKAAINNVIRPHDMGEIASRCHSRCSAIGASWKYRAIGSGDVSGASC